MAERLSDRLYKENGAQSVIGKDGRITVRIQFLSDPYEILLKWRARSSCKVKLTDKQDWQQIA
jgi:hypothetical protein